MAEGMNVGSMYVGLGVDPTELQRGLAAATQSVERFGADFRRAASGLILPRDLVPEVGKLAPGLAEASRGFRSFATSGGLASNVALEFSRGIGDARYGLFAVANNAEQAISQFALLSRQAGGARAALAAVGSSLLGPIGIVAGFSAAVALGPKVVDFFNKSGAAARQAKADFESALGALISYKTIEGESVEVGSVEQGRRSLSELEGNYRRLTETLKAYTQERRTLARATAQGNLDETDPELYRSLRDRYAEVGREIERLTPRVGQYNLAIEQLTKGLASLEQREAARNLLRGVGLDAAKSEEEVRALRQQVEELGNAFPRLEARVDPAAQKIVDLFEYIRANRLPDLFDGNFARNRQLAPLLEIPRQIDVIRSKTLELGEAFRTSLGVASGFVDDISRSFGDAVFSIFDFGGALSEAEQILARLDFEDARDRLREAFEEGRITAERYRAELDVLQQRQDEFNASISPIQRGFKTLADGIVASMKRVVAAIAEAIAKALVLRLLTSIFPNSPIIGAISGGIGAGAGAGGGVSASVVSSPAVASRGVPVGGSFAAGGGDLLTATRQNTAEVRLMREELRSTLLSVGQNIASTYADPNAARRSRDLADRMDRLKNPRLSTL